MTQVIIGTIRRCESPPPTPPCPCPSIVNAIAHATHFDPLSLALNLGGRGARAFEVNKRRATGERGRARAG